MKNRRLVIVGFLLLFFAISNAQEGDKLGSWYIYNGFFKFSPKTELFFETQWRTYEPIQNSQTLFFRPFFSYNFNPNFQLSISQEYHKNWSFGLDPEDKVGTEEYRTTIQPMLFHGIGRVSLQHRFRYEWRFLDEKGKQRTRYRIQLGIPISKPVMEKGVFFTTLGNEFMVDVQPEVQLSQMRTYAMLGYQLSKTTNLQFGYMYISRPRADDLHRLQFLLTQKFAFFQND
ncbi:MAG: DUF2490 domain-containing protein [Maribacter sp.]|nr:DUF2490 domain-containing protein [Maribacter sp.]